MAFSDIFTLNNSIAPKLIRILYVVALVLISICVIAGVARGIATMARSQAPRVTIIRPAPPPPAPVAATPAQTATETPAPMLAPSAQTTPAPATPATTPTQTAPQTTQAPVPDQRLTRRELRERGVGPRFERRGGNRNSILMGTLRIVGALVAGAEYPVHTPYGFNGGFYYARIGWKF